MAVLKIQCPHCGHMNRLGASFCTKCRTPLESQPLTPANPPTPQDARSSPPQPPPPPAGYYPPQPPPIQPQTPYYPPPQPQGYYPPPQPPGYYAPPPQPVPFYRGPIRKGGSGCGPAALIIGILTFLGVIGLVAALLLGGGAVALFSLQKAAVTGSGSIKVSSAQAGVVTTPAGAKLEIPAGSVPLMDNGSQGTMVFSLEETSQSASLPAGRNQVGSIFQLGPEGFTFNTPVSLTLPIPDGVDPQTVGGAIYFDSGANAWVFYPASVNSADRTVQIRTNHFSPWGLWSSMRTMDNDHGKVVIQSPDVGIYTGESDRNLNAIAWYGVCIVAWTPDDPQAPQYWTAPYEYKIGAQSDGPNASYWLPPGSYTLAEYYGESEINNDPSYIPRYFTSWQNAGIFRIDNGDILEFIKPDQAAISTWMQGRPPCWGSITTAVGTGEIQVTLTWQKSIDVDLYVTDPNGETIMYNSPSSTSGGQLDRDNKCENFEMGRPENIFWSADPPPPNGEYIVSVNYYDPCADSGSVSFNVRVVTPEGVKNFTGVLTEDDETQEVTRFKIR